MRFEVTLGQNHLPVTTDKAEVTFLFRLLPDPRKEAAEHPIDLRMVLDRSGSMGEEADGGMTKMEALQEAIGQSLDVMRVGKDRLSIVTFHSVMQILLNPTVLTDTAAVRQLINQIQPGNMTNLSDALQYALEVAPMQNALPKVIIFTDGLVNYPSGPTEHKKCGDLAHQANTLGIPLALFGTGIDYDERFLQMMAELAGNGSYYEHVRQVGVMRLRLEDDLENLKSIQERDISVTIVSPPRVEFLEAFKYVPQQQGLTISGPTIQDAFPGLDARGQSYLVKSMVRAENTVGDFTIAVVKVNWQGITGPKTEIIKINVDFTNDERLISPVNPTVRNTVLNTEAVKATLTGRYNRAQTLFETAGNKGMAEQVATLGKQGEDEKRTLRTSTVTNAHKGTIVGKGDE